MPLWLMRLALCVRYVSEGTVRERFLALTEMVNFDAASITTAIEGQLVAKGVEDLICVHGTDLRQGSCHEWGSSASPFSKEAPRSNLCALLCS